MRPDFVSDDEPAQIQISSGRHPVRTCATIPFLLNPSFEETELSMTYTKYWRLSLRASLFVDMGVFSLKVKRLAKDDGMCMSRNWNIIAKRMK